MQRKSKRFLSVLLSLFMCFSHLVTDVRAEGEEQEPVPVETTEADQEEEPEVTQEEEQPGIVYEEEFTEEAEDTPEPVLCWDGTYAETPEGCPVETEKTEVPGEIIAEIVEPSDGLVSEEPFVIEEQGKTTEELLNNEDGMMNEPTLTADVNINTGSCGEACTYRVTDDGVLRISGNGAMDNFNPDSPPEPGWESNSSLITKAVVDEGITTIGSFAFFDLKNLTEVELPVSSLTKIGGYAFAGCTSLASISIPESVMSIGHNAFSGCTSLTSASIPKGVTNIDTYAFSSCSSLTAISIPESVTSIGYGVFKDCTSLTSVSILEGVTSIGDYAFDNCTSMTSVSIPESVTSIGDYAFRNCQLLSSINIPEGVTSIGMGTFQSCRSLTSVTIPESITRIQPSAFNLCNNLQTVYYAGNMEGWRSVSIGSNNTLLNSATIIYGKEDRPDYNPYSGVCGDACTYEISNGVLTISGRGAMTNYNTSTLPIWNRDVSLITKIVVEGEVTSIGEYAFYNLSNVTEVKLLANSLSVINQSAFSGCSSLTSITIPESVTRINYSAFRGCTSMTSISLSDSLTFLGNSAFNGCKSLTSVIIPEGVTIIWDYAFQNCTSLTSISIPESVTDINSFAFYGCSALTDVYYAGTQEQWNAISIGAYNTELSNANIHVFHNHDSLSFENGVSISGEGYAWNGSTLTLNNFSGVFIGNPAISLPSGSTLEFIGSNTIKSVYSGPEPGIIIYFEDSALIRPNDNAVLDVIDQGFNDGIHFQNQWVMYGVNTLGTVNITTNATGLYAYGPYARFNSGKNVKLNINAARGIDYETGVDVTNTSQKAALNITASDIGIKCGVLDMGDGSYNIRVHKQTDADAGIGIKAMDIVEQTGGVGNRAGSLYIEADDRAFEYNFDYNTRIKLYNSSFAVVEPWYFAEGEECIMDLETGAPAKILSIQPVGFRLFKGTVTSESGNVRSISADAPDNGYEFYQWARANGNGTQSYGDISSMFTNAGSSISDAEAQLIPSGKTYIIATYKAINYPITYDLNDISYTSDPIHTGPKTTYTVNDSFELVNPELDGYIFTGWSGTGLTGDDNLTVTIPAGTTGELSYTAHWAEDIKSYTLTFNRNGGQFYTDAGESYDSDVIAELAKGSSIGGNMNIISGTWGALRKEGMMHTGWEDDEGNIFSKDELMSFVPEKDTVYTAQYAEPSNACRIMTPSALNYGYSFVIMCQNGEMSEGLGNSVFEYERLDEEGYSTGEFTVEQYDTPQGNPLRFHLDNVPEEIVEGNYEIHVKYQDTYYDLTQGNPIHIYGDGSDPGYYRVTFDPNSGTLQGNTYVQFYSVRKGNALEQRIGCSKEGMAFIGWVIEGGDDTVYTVPELYNYVPAGDVTFVATYGEAWNVTFKANGGTFYAGAMNETQADQVRQVLRGNSIGDFAVSTVNVLTKDGVAPVGYVKDDDTTTLWTAEEVIAFVPEADTEFTAVWEIIPESDYTYTENTDGTLTITGYTGSDTEVEIPAEIDGKLVTVIGGNLFDGNTSITRVIIPAGVTSIELYAFRNCTSLTSITIPESVTDIGSYIFQGCSGLETAGPLGSGSNIEFGWTSEIPGRAFARCVGLTSIIIPDTITNIGARSFQNCTSLTNLVIPDSVRTIGDYAFNACTSLTSIIIPDSVTSIGSFVFSGCRNLTSVTIPSSVITIGNHSFQNCSALKTAGPIGSGSNIEFGWTEAIPEASFSYSTGLESIIIPETVTTIEESAFMGCSNLTKIELPDNVISIDYRAFYDCSGLADICLPVSLASIGDKAFYRCTNIANVYYLGSQSQWNDIAIGADNDPLINATIHYDPCYYGHLWTQPAYTWTETEYGYTVTATAVCENDPEHVLTETVDAEYSVVLEPSYTHGGEGLYTAEFENEVFETQTKPVSIDRLLYVYHITWDANGGSFPTPSYMWEQDVTEGNPIGQSFGAMHDTKTFIGYKIFDTDGNELTELMNPVLIGQYIPETDIIVRAIWGHRITVHLGDAIGQFVPAGENKVNDNPYQSFDDMTGNVPVMVEENNAVNVLVTAETDKIFLGWSVTEGSDTVELTTDALKNLVPASNLDLYPVWSDDCYGITFDAMEDGSFITYTYAMPENLVNETRVIKLAVRKGEMMEITWNPDSNNGEMFAGFSLSPDPGVVEFTDQDISEARLYTVDQDMTLYAMYGDTVNVNLKFGTELFDRNLILMKGTSLDLTQYTPVSSGAVVDHYEVDGVAYNGEPITRNCSIDAVWISDYDYKYNDDGTVTVTGYTSEDGNVTIPEEIAGNPVTVIGADVFNDNAITTITIPGTVTTIDEHAFDGCDNLGYIYYGGTAEEWENTGAAVPESVTVVDGDTQNTINDLVDNIGAIGTVTLDSTDEITAAREAYDTLGDQYKDLVTNYDVLIRAEETFDVLSQIDSLNDEITLEDKDAVKAAREAYEELTDDQKALITNLEELENAETAIAGLDQAKAGEVIAMITELGDITAEDRDAIDATRAAFEALDEDQKALVTNLAVLERAEEEIVIIEDDIAAAGEIVTQITDLPETVTLEDKTAVEAARAAYERLTQDQKAYVTNYDVLTAAEAAIEKIETDIAAAEEVIVQIDTLPDTLTLEDKETVEAVRAVYDALTGDQKALVTNYAELTNAEETIMALEDKLAADKAAAQAVDEMITAVTGDDVLTLEEMIVAAETAYAELTDDQKAFVTKLDVLQTLRTDLDKAKADKAAADAVIAMIEGLPESLTLEDKSTIEAIREAYNALTDVQKVLAQDYLTELVKAEETIIKLEDDKAAAEAVMAMIEDLTDEITLEDKDAVKAVRQAYEELTDDQKALITNLDVLDGAENTLAEQDQAKADEVIAMISALGEVTVDDKAAVEAVRAAYEALDDDQKALVTNYDVLTSAEETIAAQEEELSWGDVAAEDRHLFNDATEVPDGIWIVGVPDSVTYDGVRKTPVPRVYDHKKLLKEKTDYTLGYKNNTNAGTATVTIRMKGNYTGNQDVNYTIKPIDLTDNELVTYDPLSMQYSGNILKPNPAVYYNGKKLGNNSNYTIDYTGAGWNQIDAGIQTILIHGKGNYTGTVEVIVKISRKEDQVLMSKLGVKTVNVPYVSGMTFDDVVINGLTVRDNQLKEDLVYGTDYIVENKPAMTGAGSYTFWITGTNDRYIGDRKVTVKVTGIAITDGKVKVNIPADRYVYTGDKITLTEAELASYMTYNGEALKAEDLEIVTITNNINTGNAKITIRGLNGFTGTRNINFRINPKKDVVPSDLIEDEYWYVNGGVKPAFVINDGHRELTAGKDYNIQYQNNNRAGTATLKITFKGNYNGSQMYTEAYTIKVREPEIRIAESAPYMKNGAKPEVEIVEGERVLVEGKDYTLRFQNNNKVGTAKITVTFKGDYNGVAAYTQEYEIIRQELSQMNITAKDVTWANRDGNYKSNPVVKDLNGKNLGSGSDYDKNWVYEVRDGDTWTVLGPKERVESGSEIRVTVHAREEAANCYYTGSVSYIYRVTAKDINRGSFTIRNQEYTGSEVTLSEADFTKAEESRVHLVYGTDYEIVRYENNIKVGTAKVIIRGLGNYGGEKTLTFRIGQRSIINHWKGLLKKLGG